MPHADILCFLLISLNSNCTLFHSIERYGKSFVSLSRCYGDMIEMNHYNSNRMVSDIYTFIRISIYTLYTLNYNSIKQTMMNKRDEILLFIPNETYTGHMHTSISVP